MLPKNVGPFLAEMKFSAQTASDIIRNGLGFELLDQKNNVVAEIFRCDENNTLEISLFSDPLPAVEIEKLIRLARIRSDSFEDGTPLPQPLS